MTIGHTTGDAKKRFRKRLWERDEGLCQICYAPVGLEEFSVDHIIPRARGGSNRMENLQVTHHDCNHLKDDRMLLGELVRLDAESLRLHN